MGGTIHFVSNRPNLHSYRASVHTVVGGTQGDGHNFEGDSVVSLLMVERRPRGVHYVAVSRPPPEFSAADMPGVAGRQNPTTTRSLTIDFPASFKGVIDVPSFSSRIGPVNPAR